jgi:hypothetical protein
MIVKQVPLPPFSSPSHLKRATLIATTMLIAVIYAATLQRDVAFWDTGELQTVLPILGLAHPTGYPAEILAGWAFTHIMPFCSNAFGVNLFYMLTVVVASMCGCAAAVRLGANVFAAALAMLCFAFSPVTWSHATHADVTDPALMLCAITLLLMTVCMANQNMKYVLATAICVGLAMGTHGEVVWFLPGLFGLSLTWRLISTLATGTWAVAVTVAVVAIEYAYLPLRSAYVSQAHLDPTEAIGMPQGMAFWDMGHPASLEGFAQIVSGEPAGAPSKLLAFTNLAEYPQYAKFALTLLRAEYSIVILMILVLSVIFAIKRTHSLAWLTLPLFMVTPFATAFRAETDPSRYYTLPLLFIWILFAIGVTAAFKHIKPHRVSVLAILLLTAFPAYEIYAGRFLFFATASPTQARVYIRAVRQLTKDGAIVVAPWVYATPLAYAAYVERSIGRRYIVAYAVEDVERRLPGWIKKHPTYVISETMPQLPLHVSLVRAVGVNVDASHDPKIFRLDL